MNRETETETVDLTTDLKRNEISKLLLRKEMIFLWCCLYVTFVCFVNCYHFQSKEIEDQLFAETVSVIRAHVAEIDNGPISITGSHLNHSKLITAVIASIAELRPYLVVNAESHNWRGRGIFYRNNLIFITEMNEIE